MSVSDWIAVGAFCLGLAAGWVQMVRHWRGTEDADTAAFGWLPFGADVRRGIQRALPTAIVGGTHLLFWCAALLVDVEVVHSGESVGSPNSLDFVIVAGIGLAVVIFFALLLKVIFFNRPKFVIAPHYRNDKGVLRAWLDDRAQRTPLDSRPD